MRTEKWINSVGRRRAHAKFRRHLCSMLNCPIESCFTTGELLRDVRAQRQSQGARRNIGWRGLHAV